MQTTKYGSKSSENKDKRHFFRWGEEGPGHGKGKCIYCGCKLELRPEGARGGKERVYYSKDNKRLDAEPMCVSRSKLGVAAKPEAQATAHKSPAKKQAKSGTAAKRGSSKAKRNAAKASQAAARRGSKKRSSSSAKKQAAEEQPASAEG